MNKTKVLLIVAALWIRPAASVAQTVAPDPIELGVSVAAGAASFLASDFGSDGIYGARGRGAGVHVVLPINHRFAIQPFVSYGRWSQQPYQSYGVSGGQSDYRDALAGIVVEQRFPLPRPTLRLFMTYGLALGYERRTVAPVVYTVGRVQRTAPASTSEHGAEVPVSIFGAGVQQRIARHVAVRAEAQAVGLFIVPLGVRASIGLAVPLGK